jgi:hypothetical protein
MTDTGWVSRSAAHPDLTTVFFGSGTRSYATLDDLEADLGAENRRRIKLGLTRSYPNATGDVLLRIGRENTSPTVSPIGHRSVVADCACAADGFRGDADHDRIVGW